MNELISKELLSLVLDEDIPDFRLEIDKGKNAIDSCIEISCWDNTHKEFEACYDINLDTLNRLCKEWCIKQDGMISIYCHQDTIAVSVSLDRGLTKYSSPSMSVYTELEAIIKATEWVAKEKRLL